MPESYKNPRLYETYDRNLTSRLEDRLKTLSLEPDFTENALSILKKRYFRKNEQGMPQEDVGILFRRVAANIAYPDYFYNGNNEEETYETAKRFYEMMLKREFMPNSPTLMNAGREKQQLSACFVLPVEDSIESIFEGIKNTALVQQSGGGTGFYFGDLRRKNDYVSSTHGKASGPVSFLRGFNEGTNSVNQGGFRRGANMGMESVHHPDVLEFIHAKETEGTYSSFNFSVSLTDEFMNALEKGEHYVLKNPRKGKLCELTTKDLEMDKESVKQGLMNEKDLNLIVEGNDVFYQNILERNLRGNITTVEKKKVGRVDETGRITLDSKIIFDEIASLAWKNGEPGIAFIDEINRHNPTHPKYYKGEGCHPLGVGVIKATNPCGEQPLLPYEACNLGSINLALMIKDGKIDYKKLEKTVKDSVHFLDNVIDMSNFTLSLPEERIKEVTELMQETLKGYGIEKNYKDLETLVRTEIRGPIEKVVRKNRKIGLGVMGFADMLVQLNMPYNSDQAFKLAEEIMEFIEKKGFEKSQEFARERGHFPNFEHSVYTEKRENHVRNATITTIAPTGTISIIASASSGIEPFFALNYSHTDSDGQKREFLNEYLIEDLQKAGIDSKKVIKDLESGKNLRELEYVPEKIKKVYIIAGEISYEDHVKMQAAFQKHTHNAVSKTINMKNSGTIEDVKNAYLLAYKLGCKGITVYRDGSREEQVLEKKVLEKDGKGNHLKRGMLEKAPEILPSVKIRQTTPFGHLHMTFSYEPKTERAIETFAQIGKGGDIASSDLEAICRLISVIYRLGGDEKMIIDQLSDIGSNISTTPTKDGQIKSLPAAIAIATKKFVGLRESDLVKKVTLGEIASEKALQLVLEASKETKNQNHLPPIKKQEELYGLRCEDCGAKVEVGENCKKCHVCGWSKCG